MSRWPAIRADGFFERSRSRSAMNGVAALPRPRLTAAIRSDGDSRSMNALAAPMTAAAPPGRMWARRRRWRSDGRRSRFRSSCSLRATACSGFRCFRCCRQRHPFRARRRERALPSMRTVKSAGVRFCQRLALAVHDRDVDDVTSTDDLEARLLRVALLCRRAARRREHRACTTTEDRIQTLGRSICLISPARHGIPAAREPDTGRPRSP